MGKIGMKIFKGQLIVILVLLLMTIISFNFLSKKYLIYETHAQLKKQGMLIGTILKKSNFEDSNIQKMIDKKQLKTASQFFDSEIIILNTAGRIVYKNSNHFDSSSLKVVFNMDEPKIDGYIAEKIMLVNQDGDRKGAILLMTKINGLNQITNLMMGSLWMSFIIAGMIAIIIGKIFEKSITKPIMQLMNKMNHFTIKNIEYLDPIQTEDEIQALDKSFMKMGLKIKKYNEEQEKFFQNTSHELKTPLMSIQGYAEGIKDGVIEEEEIEESLDIIIKESQRLKKLVDEIIYITKIENREDSFAFKPISIKVILEEAVKSIKALAYAKNIFIEQALQEDHILELDEEKILRVFINILGNAIRYAQSTIKIKMMKDDGYLEIFIIDDGFGFKNKEEEKIFNRFYKGKNGETGLGLTIAKMIIERHGGKICAYNNIDIGAVFKITFPI